MIKAIMIGDSSMWGAINLSRHQDHPQLVLNREQAVFDFQYNYSTPGASFGGILSTDPSVRASNGLPYGQTLEQVLQTHQDVGAVLFGMSAGNDQSGQAEVLAQRINHCANACINANKIFAFVGGPDVNISDSYDNYPNGADFYTSGYLQKIADIVGNMEVLRQVCLQEGYPFVDVKNRVKIDEWNGITCDIIHPSQDYSRQIYTYVAKAITGQVS
jgi:hypothetical protein